jgi:hypothetical protein
VRIAAKDFGRLAPSRINIKLVWPHVAAAEHRRQTIADAAKIGPELGLAPMKSRHPITAVRQFGDFDYLADDSSRKSEINLWVSRSGIRY